MTCGGEQSGEAACFQKVCRKVKAEYGSKAAKKDAHSKLGLIREDSFIDDDHIPLVRSPLPCPLPTTLSPAAAAPPRLRV